MTPADRPSKERVEQAARAAYPLDRNPDGTYAMTVFNDTQMLRREGYAAALTAAGVAELEAEVARLRAQEITDAEYISRLRAGRETEQQMLRNALPALAAADAARAVLGRVEALADEWEWREAADPRGVVLVSDLRAALSSDAAPQVAAVTRALRTHWPVGTRLVGDEGYGPTTIRITYVSDQYILAINEATGSESSWTLGCRDWVPVADAPAAPEGHEPDLSDGTPDEDGKALPAGLCYVCQRSHGARR